MKIVKFEAENFKRLQCVEIAPDGALVQISGKNGAGKSSVLDAIWAALAGKSASPAVPIRKGQERARIRLDLGELVVTRTFDRDEVEGYTTRITLEGADGSRYKAAQSVLDGMMGALAFDPLAFAGMKPREQYDALRHFVPDFDFDKHEKLQEGDKARRTELNRAARDALGAHHAIIVPPGTPETGIDEAALTAQLETAAQENVILERRRANREKAAGDVEILKSKVESTRKEADRRRQQASELDKEADAIARQAEELAQKLTDAGELSSPVDTTQLRDQIESARAVNANVRKLEERRGALVRAESLQKQADAITDQINARDDQKRSAIQAAKLPVEGLGFGDGCVMLDGLPFEQGSGAQKLRASLAVAMAGNPLLRIVRIQDGSLLDDDGLRLVAEMAAERDMQVWIEVVRSDDSGRIVLEDGVVKAQHRAGAAATHANGIEESHA